MTSLGYDVTSARTVPAAVAPSLATATAFALSFAAGALDALAFLRLRGSFTAPEYVVTLVGVTVATLAFAGALFVGFRLIDARRRRMPMLLWVATTAAVLGTAGTNVGAVLLVIALSAAALAIQTAGARRITELAGVPSRDGHVWLRLGSIPTLVAGAVLGIAVVAAAPTAAPLISAAATIAAVVLVRRVDLHRR